MKDLSVLTMVTTFKGLALANPTDPVFQGLSVAVEFYSQLYGDLFSNKLEEVGDFFKNNKEIFSASIVSSKGFREALHLLIEEHVLERFEEKRKACQRIFMGFIKSGEKDAYELERLFDTMRLISVNALKFLAEPEFLSELLSREELLAKFPNKEPEQTRIELRTQLVTKYANGEYPEIVAEIVERGIYRVEGQISGGFGGGESIKYYFTNYGRKFIEIVKANQ